MTIPPHSVRVDSGKYTFIKHAEGRIEILRHGEPWHEQEQAFHAIASIMAELDAARVVLDAARVFAPGSSLYRLRGALARHAVLVTDTIPPSDWCAAPTAHTLEPAANERQQLPITRWTDAIAGSEVLIDGHRHTIEGDCCARTACLDCAGTDSRGSHLIRHQQPVMGGTASICERCPDDAHRWKAREASNEARQPPSAVHPASVYPAALELLAQRARQWAAAERLADERAAALETATETLAKPDTHDWLDNVHRYACAQAGARVAGKVADDTLDWLKEAAMALLTEGE